MVQVEKVDTTNKAQVEQYIQFHYDLYKNCPQWVPPFRSDIKLMFNREKHPYYEHSEAEFFVAKQGKEIVGRIAVLENRAFNRYHETKKANFYLYDSIEDQEVTDALFARASEWAFGRGLTEIVGPKGFAALDGYGIQVEGHENRQMMTMMNYNYPYYQTLVEKAGFSMDNQFVSCYIKRDDFKLPEKAQEVARRVRARGTFTVKKFKNKQELIGLAQKIGQAYNKAFVNNWEYAPLTEREIKLLLDSILVVADPRLIKIIFYKDEIAGFLCAFPDISRALQRHNGKITPWAVVDYMLELKRTNWVAINGMGMLPEYHGFGGNVLMYDELVRTVNDYNFEHAEATQMADTAVQVRKDMITLGARIYKVHRVYHKML
jgi:hypothetical protein